jgi:hypothetical protein
MKLQEARDDFRSINVNKTRAIAGRVIKTIFSELSKLGATRPSDQHRYLRAILRSLEQRGDKIISREFKKMKLQDVTEAHKYSKADGRDYEREKKFNDTPKARAYRAKLNKYNRDKGTYANDDGKDASHKDGEIVGFEPSSKNKGRREKSRKGSNK